MRIDRFDLLTVQGTLKSLLQNHSTKASILQSIFVYKAISRFRTILLGWIPKGRIAGSEGMNGWNLWGVYLLVVTEEELSEMN